MPGMPEATGPASGPWSLSQPPLQPALFPPTLKKMSRAVVLRQLQSSSEAAAEHGCPFQKKPCGWVRELKAALTEMNREGALGKLLLAFPILLLSPGSRPGTQMTLHDELHFPQTLPQTKLLMCQVPAAWIPSTTFPCSIKSKQVLTQQSCRLPRTIN